MLYLLFLLICFIFGAILEHKFAVTISYANFHFTITWKSNDNTIKTKILP